MDYLKKMLPVLSLICLTTSCSNDFELVGPWKDIPVVYGLLSLQDTAHYIRIEKAFVDPSTSAYTIAQNPDSLYYQNATVQIKSLSTGDTYPLQRVDGSLDGYPREDGPFASTPNYLYKILASNISLQPTQAYELQINRGDNKPLVTAQTTTIAPLTITRPNPAATTSIEWEYEKTVKVNWRGPAEAIFADLKFVIHYEESLPNNPSQYQPKNLIWAYKKNISMSSDASTKEEIPGIALYQFLENNIDGTQNLKRIFQSIDIVIQAGGQELDDYISTGQANTGITSSQTIPTYTNLSEGFGIFSATTILSESFLAGPETRDSLKFGTYTQHLNFQ